MEFEQVDTNDLLAFGSCYGLTINPTFVPNNTAGGPIHDAESALDIEAVAALAPSAHLYVYEAQNSSNNQLTMLEQIANADTAKVVTTSWGECEQDLPPNFAAMENTQLAKMAMQGQTFVAASGDTGSSDCYGTDGGQELSVDDPGSQPYAVSAGGTELLSTSGPTGETVWNSADGAGGGGSSIIWPRSSFQPALAAGREVPDVSSDADPRRDSLSTRAVGSWSVAPASPRPHGPRCSPSSTRARCSSAGPIRPSTRWGATRLPSPT